MQLRTQVPSLSISGSGLFRLLFSCRDTRQVHGERAALAQLTADLDLASKLFREPVHMGKAQARAVPHSLSGEEGFKDLLEVLGRNAATGVADGLPYISDVQNAVQRRRKMPMSAAVRTALLIAA